MNPRSFADERSTRLLEEIFAGVAVVTEERRLSGAVPPIHPREAAAVAGAVVVRQRQFAVGRACARRALARLGIEEFVLLNGPDRAPIWPEGIVGSITHTGGAMDGFCGVVVGRSSAVAGLGVDAERPDGLDPSLWPMVLRSDEEAAVRAQPEDRRRQLATLYFSAKESVYKAVFPGLRTFLDFQEVELDPFHDGQFVAIVRRPGWESRPLRGRFVLRDDVLVTGVSLPLDRPSLSVAGAVIALASSCRHGCP